MGKGDDEEKVVNKPCSGLRHVENGRQNARESTISNRCEKMHSKCVVQTFYSLGIAQDCVVTVTPKTLSILTSMVVRAAHHQTPWESRLALVELNIEDTLGYKIAPWVM